MAAHTVTFNNNNFNTVNGLTVLSVNSYLMPKRTIVRNDIIRSNSSKISTGNYFQKDIAISVGISRDTRANVESSKDTLFGLIQGLEKQLNLFEAGELRSYKATYSDYVIKVSGGSYLEMDLIFTCSEVYGYALPYEKLLDATGRTLYNYTDSFTTLGNTSQAPIVTVFLSALSGSTTNNVSVGNPATGQFITVNRVWTAGDRLIVDVRNRTVKVNGSDVSFTGAFPEFDFGIGYINYQDDFVSRTLAISVYYNRRYL